MKFKLLSPHYINQQVLPEGTVVGDVTEEEVVFYDGLPSTQMVGLDDESRKAIENLSRTKMENRINAVPPPASEENTGGLIAGRAANPAAPRTDLVTNPNPNSIGALLGAKAEAK